MSHRSGQGPLLHSSAGPNWEHWVQGQDGVSILPVKWEIHKEKGHVSYFQLSYFFNERYSWILQQNPPPSFTKFAAWP